MPSLEQLRQPRLGPFAVFDFVGTMVIAWIITLILNAKREKDTNYVVILVTLLLFAEIIHYQQKITTPFTRMLGC